MNNNSKRYYKLIKDNYGLDILNASLFTKRVVKFETNVNSNYLIKKTNMTLNKKLDFLSGQGINNILYPMLNNNKKFVTSNDNENIYLSNYIQPNDVIPQIKFNNMFNELVKLHQNTTFKKQLNSKSSRSKIDEISKQLNYKFINMEEFVRSVESKPLNEYSMKILGNYHFFLEAKKEMVKLERLIINSVKEKETVDFSFIHNNPKLDHLLIYNGDKYLTSIDNSKIGIFSLDLAKLYLENEELNIDFKTTFYNFFQAYENEFYFNYFKFLILFIIIKRTRTKELDSYTSESFAQNAKSINYYYANFSQKQDEI